jgi:hypothetical protein
MNCHVCENTVFAKILGHVTFLSVNRKWNLLTVAKKSLRWDGHRAGMQETGYTVLPRNLMGSDLQETVTQFPQFALLHSVTCVQLRLIRILGNCGCVAVASFLGVPSPYSSEFPLHFNKVFDWCKWNVDTSTRHWWETFSRWLCVKWYRNQFQKNNGVRTSAV